MACALCRNNTKLCKSHIISNFLYRELFKGGKKAHVLSTQKGSRPQKRSSGVYELLLCDTCEKKRNLFENYARKVLYASSGFYVCMKSIGPLYSGIDYKRFKLFQLWMLWMAAISSRSEFEGIQLPKEDLERLRQLILNSDPGSAREFGCMIFASPVLVKNLPDFIMMPHLLENDFGLACMFPIGGLFWYYWLPLAPQEAERDELILTTSGEMLMPLSNQLGIEFFSRFINDLVASGYRPREQQALRHIHSTLPYQ